MNFFHVISDMILFVLKNIMLTFTAMLTAVFIIKIYIFSGTAGRHCTLTF